MSGYLYYDSRESPAKFFGVFSRIINNTYTYTSYLWQFTDSSTFMNVTILEPDGVCNIGVYVFNQCDPFELQDDSMVSFCNGRTSIIEGKVDGGNLLNYFFTSPNVLLDLTISNPNNNPPDPSNFKLPYSCLQ